MNKKNTKYFKIAGISIEVNSDLPFTINTFAPKFNCFETTGHLDENIVLNHYFHSYDDPIKIDPSNSLYFHPPWAIY